MNVYMVRADVAFGNVLIPEDVEAEAMWGRNGHRSPAPWTPPQGEAHDGFIPADCVFSNTTSVMLLNRRARDALGTLLSSCGEFLPMRLGHYDYAWFNCWTERDAVDWERSDGESRRRDGSFRRIRRFEFVPDRLSDAPTMFRVENGNLDLFCTDVLRDAVARHDLTGFAFEPVWSSDGGGIRRPFIGIEGTVGEAGRLRGERNRQACRDMLDRMAADGTIAAAITTESPPHS